MIHSKNTKKKIKVLVIVGHYLPGFKSGGILRSVENTVNYLCDEFDYFIVTRNHDIGDTTPYLNINLNQWQTVGHSKVLYLDPPSFSNICRIVNLTPHDLIHLNSFFDPLSIKVLLGNKIGKIKCNPIVLSPRGDFGWASLRIRFYKKLVYMLISKLFGFFNGIIWHVSSMHEKKDIMRIMRVKENDIRVAKDLPLFISQNYISEPPTDESDTVPVLRVVFISNIGPEKNLHYAINVLSKVKEQIVFNIYGRIVDEKYWGKCQGLINTLPDHVLTSYLGELKPNEVVGTFSKYDLFFFPSGGENYGHVIAESLSSGTPVLISKNTPWLDLKSQNLGWDIDLKDMDSFVEIIEKVARMSHDEHQVKRNNIRKKIKKILINSKDFEDNRFLYRQSY
jgi:glycosyltransferase involved in cell wall biosynthesis